ncbi:hypothetical protein CHLRE_03g181700v5 [Chlamydomonas reinhardtii]|uniref:Protein kinase domain-containing protein n=1 Tax=Chlamydomonas reinhardtii TaxID=3055 RepID=A0A2K3DXU1_CHLRE|nr:uncharacterized protein CHLRE_03g181700v5 [Chlamydomonas reinhardtii]PNW85338.1 hypothetical protein CHLRE_03g181700v5 [Chlamydomonas reinhardtii]
MSLRRKSVDVGSGDHQLPASPGGRGKMQNALLKLSTANAFARGSWKPPANPRGSVDLSGGDDGGGWNGADGVFPYSDAELDAMLPPQVLQPVSPFYGMYGDYDEVMDLLHTAVMADGSSRSTLQHIPRDNVVHVAHLGLGACCSVDLVAVHGAPDGSQLLAAAKSCYLPANDPRMKASLKEAELLRRCADCAFIMQLLSVIQYNPLEDVPCTSGGGGLPSGASASTFVAAAKASFEGGGLSRSGSFASPHGMAQGRASLHSYELGAFGGGSLLDSTGTESASGGAWAGGGGVHLASRHSGQLNLTHMGSGGFPHSNMPGSHSPGYQAWEQWRGGGNGSDVEQQLRQRMASTSEARRSSFSLASQGSFIMGTGVTGGWDSAGMVSAAASAYGGGWAYGHGGGGTIGTCGLDSPTAGGLQARQGLRRGSMEILEMYGGTGFGATGLGVGTGGGTMGWGAAAGGEGAQARGGPNAPTMYTLLVGWARCGDLRRLVQLQLAKNTAQGKQNTGTSSHPVICEDASRFYVGCLLLALEHLHCRLNTVHRDLKLANLLLLGNGYAIVGDLGTAVDLSTVPNGRLTSRVGSPGHMAPECQNRDEAGYDLSADMWSVGACLFSLLTGSLPAGVAGPPNRSWTPPLSRHWSHELQDFLGRLLAWSPRDRPTVAQAMKDPWFRGFDWGALRSQKMPPPSNTPWRELLWWPKVDRSLL